MKSISLGQYYPAKSIIHSLDPRIKVILAILYIVCSFLCRSTVSFAALLLFSLVIVILSRIPMRIMLGALKPIMFILVFTAVVNIFMIKGEDANLLFSWKFIHIYKEGLFNAAFMTVRILALIVGSTVFLTYTTTPIMLTDAIEHLLSPLHKLFKVRVHEFAMMMTIALRFIPTFVDEADKIMAAQKSRGADFTSGNIIRRAKALIPVLIPLFVSAYHKAIDLATAMECRCYRGGDGRTRMNVLKYRVRDLCALVLIITLGVGLVFLNKITFIYVMK